MVAHRLELLHDVADAVAAVLHRLDDRGESGARPGQYVLDVQADSAALDVLERAGVAVLSEESGLRPGRRDGIADGIGDGIVVVIDPVDGSTNASRGIGWYATSLCFVDADGPLTALVADQASGVRYTAERGVGAWRDGEPLGGSGCTDVAAAIVGLNGLPPAPLGTAQVRMFGAAALDLCQVAAGVLDGYVDCVADAHGVWDHAAAVLVCQEAGVSVTDAWGRDLVPIDHAARRTPVAAATPELLAALVAARRRWG